MFRQFPSVPTKIKIIISSGAFQILKHDKRSLYFASPPSLIPEYIYKPNIYFSLDVFTTTTSYKWLNMFRYITF